MTTTHIQKEQIKDIFQQLGTGLCEIIVLEETGDFSNRMIFQTPQEALEIIEKEDFELDVVDVHRRELAILTPQGILFFIKFNDLKTDEDFSLV